MKSAFEQNRIAQRQETMVERVNTTSLNGNETPITEVHSLRQTEVEPEPIERYEKRRFHLKKRLLL